MDGWEGNGRVRERWAAAAVMMMRCRPAAREDGDRTEAERAMERRGNGNGIITGTIVGQLETGRTYRRNRKQQRW